MCRARVHLILVWLLIFIEERKISGSEGSRKRDYEKMAEGSSGETSNSPSYRGWFSCDAGNPYMKATDYVYHGLQLQSDNQHEEAIKCFTKAIIMDSSKLAYYRLRGICYLEMGSPLAREDFVTVGLLEKRSNDKRLSMSKTLFESQMFDEAIQGKTIVRTGLPTSWSINHEIYTWEKGDQNNIEILMMNDTEQLVNLATRLSTEAAEHKKALLCYEMAIADDPNVPKYYRERAKCSVKLRLFRPAFDDFRKLLELEPLNPENKLTAILGAENYDELTEDSIRELTEEESRTLGTAFFDRKNFEAAIQCLTDAINKNPTVQSCYRMRGIAFLEVGKPKMAIEDFRRVIEIDPSLASNTWKMLGDTLFVDRFEGIIEDFLAQLNQRELESLGNELLSENKFQETIRCYSVAIQNDPWNYSYLRIRAQCYTNIRAFDKAALDYFLMIQTDSQNKEEDLNLLKLTLFNLQTLDSSTRKTLRVFDESELEEIGFEFFSNGKFGAASYYCTELIERNPSEGRHFMQRGTCFMRMENWTAALNDFVKLLEMQPHNQNYQMCVKTVVGVVHQKFSRIPDDLLNIIPPNELAYFGSKFFLQNQFDDALRYYNAAINRDNSVPQYYFERGRCYETKKNAAMAAIDYGKALELDPENKENVVLLTRALLSAETLLPIPEETFALLAENDLVSLAYDSFSKDKFVNAIRLYSAAMRKNPTFAEYYRMRANCHLKNNQPQLATCDLRKALELEPQIREDRLNLSKLYFNIGQYNEAINEMISAQGSHREIAVLGNRFAMMGKFQEAIRCLTEAMKEYPLMTEYYRARGTCYLRINDIQNAIVDWKKVVQLNPQIEHRIRLSIALVRDKKYEEAKRVLRACAFRYNNRIPSLILDIDETMKKDRRNNIINFLKKLIQKDTQRQIDMLFQNTWFLGMDEVSQQQINEVLEQSNRHTKNLTDAYVEFNTYEASRKNPSLRVSRSLNPQNLSLIASTSTTPPAGPDTTDVSPPAYLLDIITLELMADPVVTPSGRSYDEGPLLTHLENSRTDPSTREPLHPDQLRPNLALREAIREWREKHDRP